jgi:hypothetical protein
MTRPLEPNRTLGGAKTILGDDQLSRLSRCLAASLIRTIVSQSDRFGYACRMIDAPTIHSSGRSNVEYFPPRAERSET